MFLLRRWKRPAWPGLARWTSVASLDSCGTYTSVSEAYFEYRSPAKIKPESSGELRFRRHRGGGARPAGPALDSSDRLEAAARAGELSGAATRCRRASCPSTQAGYERAPLSSGCASRGVSSEPATSVSLVVRHDCRGWLDSSDRGSGSPDPFR